MGDTHIVRNVLLVRDTRGWNWSKWEGRVSAKRLEERMHSLAKSLQPGGVNEHISKRLGFIPYPLEAKIVRQKTGEVLATWRADTFQAW